MKTLHSLHAVEVVPGEVGVTLRLGEKWFKTKDGETIELCECSADNTTHTVVGHAEIVGRWYGMFTYLPARLIEKEHEISSRMYSGLLKSMRRAYGQDFNEESNCTALSYKRID
jgi:hypothetical protein